MLVTRLIEKKRDGGSLTAGEWTTLVQAYAGGSVPDYQMSALLMAAFIRGMDRSETGALMEAMLASGERLEFPSVLQARIDKHSTGGVGDKVSLVLAPLVSCLGVAVPMMSGRGLGHTGGTLDKLESIPGFRTDLGLAVAQAQVERLGCALIGQTREIAPVDRRLYALRDATATVDAVPLIAASIMSKKLAEGLTGLVLDIKRGSGSFIPSFEAGAELARLMIELGAAHGLPVVALMTAMDRPLGRACGNVLEVEEAIQCLHGEGPPDVMEVTYTLGAEMLVMAGVARGIDEARRRMEVAISSGKAAEQFARIVEAQGGDPGVVDDPSRLPQASVVEFYSAPRTGVIARVEPRAIGYGVIALGGGRRTMEDQVDHTVGFVIRARPGDVVKPGEPLATIFSRDEAGIAAGMAALSEAITISEEADPPLPLVSHRVAADGLAVYESEPWVRTAEYPVYKGFGVQ
jgi:pyrimidine-nucleoside phosphorylase